MVLATDVWCWPSRTSGFCHGFRHRRVVIWGPSSAEDAAKPFFEAKALRHPAGLCLASGGFVANDIGLGGDHPPFIVLTGARLRSRPLSVLTRGARASVPGQHGGEAFGWPLP
jgi:hypothetical protein